MLSKDLTAEENTVNSGIFRKKSLDKVQSPDDLNDFIKVTTPGVWLIIAAVIVLLIGAVVWGVFGNMDSSCPAFVSVNDGRAVVYFTADKSDVVLSGVTVRVGETEGVVSSASSPVRTDGTDSSVQYFAETHGHDDWICVSECEIDLPDGSYNGTIVTESFKPLSFIFN